MRLIKVERLIEAKELTFATIVAPEAKKATTSPMNTVSIEMARIWTLTRHRNWICATQFVVSWADQITWKA